MPSSVPPRTDDTPVSAVPSPDSSTNPTASFRFASRTTVS